jgi:hypothetical protein
MKDMKSMKVNFIKKNIKVFFMIFMVIICMGAVVDHGGLWGLYDDDHPQYLRKDATRPLDADWDAGDFTLTIGTLIADIADVNNLGVYAMDANSLTVYETLSVGTMELAGGSLEDSSGSIDFGSTDWVGIGSMVAGDFTSVVATGTAPFFCDSTTLCTNLNADMLDGYHAAAFARTDTAASFSGLAVGGESGISATLTIYAAAAGDCNSITITGGIITGYTVVE